MMPHVRLALVTATFVCLAISASAVEATEAAFGTPFTRHAVLQRDCRLPVWGTATPGATVCGKLLGFQLAGADGKFAWDDYPDCNLANGEGLPCGPFELEVK